MKPRRIQAFRSSQRGVVLLVSLILLVLLTLFVIAAMNFTNVQSRIAGNLQVRTEMKAVAQQAIEQKVSSNFTVNPLPQDILYDVNSDGVFDYKVTVSHSCVSSLTIPVDDLVITNAEDASCTQSASEQNAGVTGLPPSNASLCANTLWDVKSIVVDAPSATFKTGGSVTTHQGIATRVAVGTNC